MCPACLSIIADAEGGVLSHLLASHPGWTLAAVGCLTVANLALVGRPADLLLVDAVILGCALVLARAPGLLS